LSFSFASVLDPGVDFDLALPLILAADSAPFTAGF